jgi:MFS superfamily sulfate permease-like transporter
LHKSYVSESLAAAKEEGSKYDYEIDASQEMVAQGMANTASGFLGGFAVEGSLSKTTVADLAGQKTQLASLFTAGLILLTILFLAGSSLLCRRRCSVLSSSMLALAWSRSKNSNIID